MRESIIQNVMMTKQETGVGDREKDLFLAQAQHDLWSI